MPDTLSEQANKATIASVKADTPQSFTVGGYFINGKLEGGITYDRKLGNLWGITAYARAYWHDLPVTTHPRIEAGVEITRKY